MSKYPGIFLNAETAVRVLKEIERTKPEESKIVDILISCTALWGQWKENEFMIKESLFTDFLTETAKEIMKHVNENYIKK